MTRTYVDYGNVPGYTAEDTGDDLDSSLVIVKSGSWQGRQHSRGSRKQHRFFCGGHERKFLHRVNYRQR